MVTRDTRFKLVDGYNLQIGNVRIQDAGDYVRHDERCCQNGRACWWLLFALQVCQIGDQEARDQVHTVEILVPPSVRPVPQNGQITARKGSTVSLECKASGNPVPNLFWHKKVRKDPKISISLRSIVLTREKFKSNSASASKLTMFAGTENYRLHLTCALLLEIQTSISFRLREMELREKC